MVSLDAGRTWASPTDRRYGQIIALACPARRTCYAISNIGTAVSTIIGTTDGGTTWTELHPSGNALLGAISCPSPTTCFATGRYAGRVLRTTDGGRSWSRIRVDFRPADLFCPTTRVCYAPIDTSLIHSPPPSVAVSIDGGRSWALRPVGAQAQLWDARCVSATTCYVIAFAGQFGDTPLVLKTRDGGRAWEKRAFPAGTYFRGGALACPTVEVCYLAGDNGTLSGILLATFNGAGSWIRRKPFTSLPSGLACTAPGRCVAVGVGGNIERTVNGWAAWTEETHNAARDLANLQRPLSLRAIACPSPAMCFAAGDLSSFLTTADSGRQWRNDSAGLMRRHLTADFSTLACPTPRTCFAGTVAQYPPGSGAQVYLTRDGGKTWSANPGRGFAVVACPSATICYAGGQRGAVRVSRDGGRTWTGEHTPLAGKQYTIVHMACPTTVVCYGAAIGPSEPPRHPSSNIGALLSTADGGRTWSRTSTDPFPIALACRTPIDCFALLSLTYHPENLITHDGGRSWSPYTPLPSAIWSSLNCVDRDTCYAVGSSGNIAVTRDGGSTWSQETTPTFNTLSGVQCVSRESCFAVGGLGTILNRTQVGT